MRHKASQKEWDEFDAWSFCRLGGRVSSADVAFDFPRIAQDENILGFQIQRWEISGHINARSESVLQLQGEFTAEFSCVSCGKGVAQTIPFKRFLVLKKSEAEADAYDDDTLDDDTDVVACPGAIQLRDCLEDELLLACPMFPRHAECQQAVEAKNNGEGQVDSADPPAKEVQRPFANLSDLLKAGKK
ncbi:MAG TPA: YceD family protein [Limnobacter sp.]|nr:YceD family protein [Limnobacter sp.]